MELFLIATQARRIANVGPATANKNLRISGQSNISLPLRPARVHGVGETDEEGPHAGRGLRKCLNPCPQPFLTGLFRREAALPPHTKSHPPGAPRTPLPQHPRARGGGRRGDGEKPEPDEKRGSSPRHCLLSPPRRTEASSASNACTLASRPRI